MGKEKTNPSEYLIAGGTAGIISRTLIAPIERVKILFQARSRGRSRRRAAATAQPPQQSR